MKLSYDPKKNARNISERGLSFDRVADFNWEAASITKDNRKDYPEPRFVAVGYLDGRLHVLCFARLEDSIRVISFRKANKRERRRYEETTQTSHRS